MSKKLQCQWSSSCGKIELEFSKAQVRGVAKSGANDEAVAELLRYPSVMRQLDDLDDAVVRDCLRPFGAWTEGELADGDENLSRLVWMACHDIAEEVSQKKLAPSKRLTYHFGRIVETFGEYETESTFVFASPADELEDTEERISVQFRSGDWDEHYQHYWVGGNAYDPVCSQRITKRVFSALCKLMSNL
jgi:hypothetical protein